MDAGIGIFVGFLTLRCIAFFHNVANISGKNVTPDTELPVNFASLTGPNLDWIKKTVRRMSQSAQLRIR